MEGSSGPARRVHLPDACLSFAGSPGLLLSAQFPVASGLVFQARGGSGLPWTSDRSCKGAGRHLREAQAASRREGRKSIFIGLAFLLTVLFPNDIYLTVFDSSYEHVSGKQDLYSLRPQLPVSS